MGNAPRGIVLAAAAVLLSACAAGPAAEAAKRDLSRATTECARAMDMNPDHQEVLLFKPYLRMAERAFEEADYEAASEYATLAAENAEDVSRTRAEGHARATPQALTSRDQALVNRDEIEKWVRRLREENDPDLDLVTLFEDLECRVEAAREAFDEGDFDLAVGHTEEALMIVDRRYFFFSYTRRDIPSREVQRLELPASGPSGSGKHGATRGSSRPIGSRGGSTGGGGGRTPCRRT